MHALHYLQLTDRWDARIRIVPPSPEQFQSAGQLKQEEVLSELRAGRVFVVSPQPGYCPRWLLDNYAFKPAGPVFQKVERRLEVEQKKPPRAAKPLDEPPALPPAADESQIARDSRFAQRRTTWMSSRWLRTDTPQPRFV